MSLVLLAVVVAEEDQTKQIIHDFVLCEAPGISANRNCDSNLTDLNKYSNLATATYTLIGLFPLVILIFTINWNLAFKKTKAFLAKKGWAHRRHDTGAVAYSTYSPLPSAIENNE